MGIRIQPRDIEIPEGNPFQNDLLDRKESAEILTHLVGSIDGPCVLAIDAAWGNGKSTFLRLWSQHLRDDNFPVVQLNAWETDYAEDPFAALSIELTDELKKHADGAVVDDVVQGAIEIGRILTPGLFRLALGIVPGGEILGAEIGKLAESYGKVRFSVYAEARDSVRNFRNNLKALAKKVSEGHDDKPVLIMIDELDRCRPSYAVELLEIAKHLFSVDRIIFVLAINREELSQSVKVLYGQKFDAAGYLKRFIDIDFMLPEPNRSKFISSGLKQTKIEEYFQRTRDRQARQDGLSLIESLMHVHWDSSVTLRQISQAIHRIGLVLATLPKNRKGLLEYTIVALILRTMHEDLYHRFREGKATDLEVIETVFPGKEHSNLLNKTDRRWFEAAIIMGYEAISGRPSVLLRSYQALAATEEPEDDVVKNFWNHAKSVSSLADPNHTHRWAYSHGFEFAIQRIEFFSGELKGDIDLNNSPLD